MSTNRRATTSFMAALAGMVGTFALLAGPAAAQTTTTLAPLTSGTARADSGSVASGSAVAIGDSTASGNAVAINGSVASGCSTATRDSTASGADCPPARVVATTTPPTTRPGGPTATTAARPAAPTAGRLALTGSSTDSMVPLALGSLLAGAVLVGLGSLRRRSTSGS